jgi:hypothetical protein
MALAQRIALDLEPEPFFGQLVEIGLRLGGLSVGYVL